jgi:hypothetical protein
MLKLVTLIKRPSYPYRKEIKKKIVWSSIPNRPSVKWWNWKKLIKQNDTKKQLDLTRKTLFLCHKT